MMHAILVEVLYVAASAMVARKVLGLGDLGLGLGVWGLGYVCGRRGREGGMSVLALALRNDLPNASVYCLK